MAFKSYEERREENRKYHADVEYEVWRSGGNMDAVNYERVQDSFYDGLAIEDVARSEVREQRMVKAMIAERGRDELR